MYFKTLRAPYSNQFVCPAPSGARVLSQPGKCFTHNNFRLNCAVHWTKFLSKFKVQQQKYVLNQQFFLFLVKKFFHIDVQWPWTNFLGQGHIRTFEKSLSGPFILFHWSYLAHILHKAYGLSIYFDFEPGLLVKGQTRSLQNPVLDQLLSIWPNLVHTFS